MSPYGYDSGYASATPELATFGSRAIGWLIDYLAPGIAVGIVGGILGSFMGSSGANALSWVLNLVAFAFVLWNSGYQAGATGYSLGRKIAKNKLVSEATGQPLGTTNGMIRVVAHFVDSIICYVGWLFPLWDSKRQTLADKIMKSVVVADPNAGQAPMQ